MKIEEEMGVKIIFPSSRNEDHISKMFFFLNFTTWCLCPYPFFLFLFAVIEGGSVDCVTKASERIATIVDEVRFWSLVLYLFFRLCSLEFTLYRL